MWTCRQIFPTVRDFLGMADSKGHESMAKGEDTEHGMRPFHVVSIRVPSPLRSMLTWMLRHHPEGLRPANNIEIYYSVDCCCIIFHLSGFKGL